MFTQEQIAAETKRLSTAPPPAAAADTGDTGASDTGAGTPPPKVNVADPPLTGGVSEYEEERRQAIYDKKVAQKRAERAARDSGLDPVMGAFAAEQAAEAVPNLAETSATAEFQPVQQEDERTRYYTTRIEDEPRLASEVFTSPGKFTPPSVPKGESRSGEAFRSPEGLMKAAARVAAKQEQVKDSIKQATIRKGRIQQVIDARLSGAFTSQPAFTASAAGTPARQQKPGEQVGQVERLRFGPELPDTRSGTDKVPYQALTTELQKADEYLARLENLDRALSAMKAGTLRDLKPTEEDIAEERSKLPLYESDFYESTALRPGEVDD